MLHAAAELPVVAAHPPSAQHVVGVLRGVRVVLPELQIADDAALAVELLVCQVTIGDVVAPARITDAVGEIVPVTGHRVDRGVDRMQGRRDVDGLSGDVLAEVHLDRGPAVAKHVVGGADPRHDVVPARQAGNRVEIARRHERTRRQVGLLGVGIQVVVADAEVQRQLVNRPLVLREEAQCRLQPLLLEVRCGVLHDRVRNARVDVGADGAVAAEVEVHAPWRRLLVIGASLP